MVGEASSLVGPQKPVSVGKATLGDPSNLARDRMS